MILKFRHTGFLLLLSSVVGILLSANNTHAQTVRIQNGLGEWGYGWMFQGDDSCFIALPEHVAGPLPKVTVSTAAPVVSDQATILKPFWKGMDLAIAIPDQGILDSRCIARLDDLKPDNLSRNAREVDLVRITASGQEVQTEMRVTKRTYLTLEAEISSPASSIGQGTSGAFAFVGSTPVGMAIESDGVEQARFIRAEEIHLHLKRFIEEQGRAYQQAVDSPRAQSVENGAVPVHSISSNVPPTLPQFGTANLLGEGLFVAEPDGPLDIVLRLEPDEIHRLSRIRVAAGADGYAVPSQIIISLSVEKEPKSFRFWTQGRMTPDGRFDTGIIAARNARWVRLRFIGSWTAGEVALRRILVD